jgi:hypothetical protein
VMPAEAENGYLGIRPTKLSEWDVGRWSLLHGSLQRHCKRLNDRKAERLNTLLRVFAVSAVVDYAASFFFRRGGASSGRPYSS